MCIALLFVKQYLNNAEMRLFSIVFVSQTMLKQCVL